MSRTFLLMPGIFVHHRCRNNIYPGSSVERYPVKDEHVLWSKPYKNYCPIEYTAHHVYGQPWADPEFSVDDFKPAWNAMDGNVDRRSYNGIYKLEDDDQEMRPINPIGRTGIRGRGLLGRWGPNHAADPIVTRWKRRINGMPIIHERTEQFILQMIAIQRSDNGMWAIPGGMIDPGEKVTATLKREFMEEALNDPNGKFTDSNWLSSFFSNGIEVYRGYVDDHRNTDNAWIETIAYNYHDNDGTEVGNLRLQAGDDAMRARWLDIDQDVPLYANHATIVEQVAYRLDAHW